jgi:hypothetical protein
MKSYKDLPREVVLNAPEGAMWAAVEQGNFKFRCFYKIQDKKLCVGIDEWSASAHSDILSAQNGEKIYLIPLPNVKIPWEATEDSVCPVPGDCMVRAWINNFGPWHRYAKDFVWVFGGEKITHYQIEDADYMREESAELVGNSEAGQLVGQSIIFDHDAHEILRRLKLLNHIGEQFPLIADCAKAAMERLVENWVGND